MTWKQITEASRKNDEKVKVTFLKAEGDSGNSFDFNTPDSYQAFYRVDPLSGNPSYQMMRRIVVEARENMHTGIPGRSKPAYRRWLR